MLRSTNFAVALNAKMKATDILRTYCKATAKWSVAPTAEAVAVTRNGLKTCSEFRVPTEEEILAAKLEEDAQANIKRLEREHEIAEQNEFWEDTTWHSESDGEDGGTFSEDEE
jgi:hypothetical protein